MPNRTTSQSKEWRCAECGKALDRLEACRDCIEKDKAEKLKKKKEKALLDVVPPRFARAGINDFGGRVSIPEDINDGVLIRGALGSGKSHLAAAILRDRYIEHPEWYGVAELLMYIRSCFKDASSDAEVAFVNEVCRAGILVLDDLGAEKTSDWSSSTMYVIINRRLERFRPTIVTTNLPLSEIEKFEPRIASRLAGFHQIKLAGKDRRLKK